MPLNCLLPPALHHQTALQDRQPFTIKQPFTMKQPFSPPNSPFSTKQPSTDTSPSPPVLQQPFPTNPALHPIHPCSPSPPPALPNSSAATCCCSAQHSFCSTHEWLEFMQDCHGPHQQGHPICGCAAQQGAGEATGSHSAGEPMLTPSCQRCDNTMQQKKHGGRGGGDLASTYSMSVLDNTSKDKQ